MNDPSLVLFCHRTMLLGQIFPMWQLHPQSTKHSQWWLRRRKAGVKIAWCDSRKQENIEIRHVLSKNENTRTTKRESVAPA
jgi:hypothetical protein